jgi:cytochrome P450
MANKKPFSYNRLRAEIFQADDLSPNLQTLPYLNAVIREGLRMGMSTPTRLPRIVPQSGWSFQNHHLPGGTLVGCQPHTLHFNPDVFPDPFAFKPERWLNDSTPEMHRDWIPFSLGARGCIARNLAWMELQFAVYEVVRQDVLKGATVLDQEIRIHEWFNSGLIGGRLELVW